MPWTAIYRPMHLPDCSPTPKQSATPGTWISWVSGAWLAIADAEQCPGSIKVRLARSPCTTRLAAKPGVLLNNLVEKGVLGTMALVTTSIPLPGGRPGRHAWGMIRILAIPCFCTVCRVATRSRRVSGDTRHCLSLSVGAGHSSLDGCRRLAGDVVHHVGKSWHFTDDAPGADAEQFTREVRPTSSHERYDPPP